MIKVKIGNKSYKIPITFKDVYIEDYIKIKNIKEDLKITDKIVKYISILLKIPEDIVKDIKIKDLKKIQDKLFFFNDKKKNFKLQRVINIKGNKYGFYENLDDMKFSEWCDLNELTKDEETINTNLHLIMGLLYRPIKKYKKRLITRRIYGYTLIDFNDKNILKNAELFKTDMNIEIVLGAYFFLFNINLKYINDLIGSTKKQNQVKEKKN